ncbi:very short patch repair endonuclease [Streptomyces sp. NPDC050534]|uniref:very short patch repair endonuclease n=1 Tax=Streptomyces sp. NPDC050534 TaxID=3365625 RepID=UPI003793808E
MGSWASSDAARATMQANRSRDTRPELALRRAVHALGLRYRVSVRPLPSLRRTADLVFTRAKVAVFLDGCFWHGCPDHHTVAATNSGYWQEKVRRNRERDRDTNLRLTEAGWLVLRIWEHEDPDEAAVRVKEAVRDRLPVRELDSPHVERI